MEAELRHAAPRARARGLGQQLGAEADAEHRQVARERLAQHGARRGHGLRVLVRIREAGQRDHRRVPVELQLAVPREAHVELERGLGERADEQAEALVGVVLDDEDAHAASLPGPRPLGKFGLGSRIISALSEWAALDLRHLAALEAIAREGTVSRAAASLGYTQSAVSQQLRALERIVGVTLVERGPGARAVELTEAGRQLLAHADAISGHLETARADLAAFADGRVGELRIGAVPSAAAALVPALAERLRGRAPRLTLAVSESYYPEELLDRLAAGALDLVLAPQDEPREGLESEPLLRDPYVLLVPAGDPFLALGRPLTAAELAGRDLIGKDCTTASQRALAAALADCDLPEPRIRACDLRGVQALVRRGLGVAVVPALLLEELPEDLATVPLGHLVPDRVVALTTRANGARTPPVELAAELLLGAATPA
jgi:molybdate transport repressor ModE-like protein